MIELTTPISEEDIRSLHAGDLVQLNGIVVTARDAGHKLMVEEQPEFLNDLLKGGVIYHCGPVVRQDDNGKWQFVAAGPTTSIREEPYQATVMEMYGVRGVIGKGGMEGKTLEACKRLGAVYFHAIGGCGTAIAESVKEVLEVHKLEEFGTPEAFWVCRVEGFTVVVTMDSHGVSVHDAIEAKSKARYEELIAR